MIHPEITSLFKYFADTKRALEVIRTKMIWYSCPSAFNDPFDCDLDIANSTTWAEFENAIRREGRRLSKTESEIEEKTRTEKRKGLAQVPISFKHQMEKGVEVLKTEFANRGVLSLTSVPNSIPMWSHYADSHKGACLEFKRHKDNPLGSTATRPVKYVEKYPKLSIHDLFKEPGYLSRTIMHSKATLWKAEQEWRVIITDCNQLFEVPGEITSIRLGLRIPPATRARILEARSSFPDVQILQAVKSARSFGLDFQPLG